MVDWGIKVIEGDLHAENLRTVYKYAFENSMDPRTKTGAMVMDADLTTMLGIGTNVVRPGLVYGKDYSEENLRDSPWKAENMIHSEDNGTSNARKTREDLTGAAMYMFWVPCLPCANIVVDSGITKYIAHKQMIEKTPERWIESCIEGVDLMKKGGVEVFMYDGLLGGVVGRMNDEDWNP